MTRPKKKPAAPKGAADAAPAGRTPPEPASAPDAVYDAVYDSEGRRADGHWLSYSDYVNVPAIVSAQRLPEDVPKGRTRAEWPTRPDVVENGETRAWRPGDRWPTTWPRDEHLFLVTHQAFELWFKQILHDLDDVMDEAIAVGEAHGTPIPKADETPAREYVTLTSGSLRLFPALAKAAEALDVDERRWLLEMPLPGFARRPSRAWSLAWVRPPALASWTHRLLRAGQILTHSTGAFDLLATMTPEAFLEFRARLVPASGFGSTQFRELEILSGLATARGAMARPPAGTSIPGLSGAVGEPSPKTPREAADLALARHVPREEMLRIDRRMSAPSLRDLVAALLDGPELCGKDDAEFRGRIDEVAEANVRSLHLDYRREALHPQGALGPRMSNRWQEIGRLLARPENVGLCWLYRHPDRHPGLVALLDAAFSWDQAVARWRAVHVAFVERMIGSRPGTGGGGVEYLRKTLELPRAFPWLADFRTILMSPATA